MVSSGTNIRRGMPRRPGGEPWPPADQAAVVPADARCPRPSHAAEVAAGGRAAAAPRRGQAGPTRPPPGRRRRGARGERRGSSRDRTGASYARDARCRCARRRAPRSPEPRRIGRSRSANGWPCLVVGWLLRRCSWPPRWSSESDWFLTLDFMQEFLVAYPGEYPLPEGAPVGIPTLDRVAALLQHVPDRADHPLRAAVRTEKRPRVFWAPRHNRKGKISLDAVVPPGRSTSSGSRTASSTSCCCSSPRSG